MKSKHFVLASIAALVWGFLAYAPNTRAQYVFDSENFQSYSLGQDMMTGGSLATQWRWGWVSFSPNQFGDLFITNRDDSALPGIGLPGDTAGTNHFMVTIGDTTAEAGGGWWHVEIVSAPRPMPAELTSITNLGFTVDFYEHGVAWWWFTDAPVFRLRSLRGPLDNAANNAGQMSFSMNATNDAWTTIGGALTNTAVFTPDTTYGPFDPTQPYYVLEMVEDHGWGFQNGPGVALAFDNLVLYGLTVPPPTVTNTIFAYNFDDKPISTFWAPFPVPGWGNAGPLTYWASNNVAGAGVGGSNAFVMYMDNTAANGNNWSGGNATFSGPVAGLTSPNIADYTLSLDLRVDGLSQTFSATSTSFDARLDFHSNSVEVLKLDVPLSGVTSNWQSFTMLLKNATVLNGSKADFAASYASITGVDVELQIQNGWDITTWDPGAYHAFVIDNFKLTSVEPLTAPAVKLNIQVQGGQAVVSWNPPSSGTVQLLSGSTLGTITNVAGTTSPHTNALSGGAQFFRTVWNP